MSDTHTPDPDKAAKAEASFKRKQEQARDGAIAMSEYIAEQAAIRARTERLRALRLAQESAQAAAQDATPAKPKKKAARRA
jgi:hypothetical protein